MTTHSTFSVSALLKDYTEHPPGADGAADIHKQLHEILEATVNPILERKPDSDMLLVTFIVRGSSQTQSVTAIGGFFDWNLTEGSFTNIPGTDVWYCSIERPAAAVGSYRLYENCPVQSLDTVEDWEDFERSLRYDSRNPHTCVYTETPHLNNAPAPHDIYSVVRLPAAPDEAYLEQVPVQQQGSLQHHTVASKVLENSRSVYMYTPAKQYAAPETGFPVLFVLDGESYLSSIPGKDILDNLIEKSLIPPLVAVFISSINMKIRTDEMPCNQTFVEFLIQELFPFVQEQVPISTNPRKNAIAGSSFGGVCSIYSAIEAPSHFGLIAAQATSAAWSDGTSASRGRILEYLDRREQVPGIYHLDIGSREQYLCAGCDRPGAIAHRELVSMLQTRAESVRSIEYEGAHDYVAWRWSFPEALIWLYGQTD